jgi:hypothetical protein
LTSAGLPLPDHPAEGLELARLLAAYRIRRRATGALLLLAGYAGCFLGLLAYLLASALVR